MRCLPSCLLTFVFTISTGACISQELPIKPTRTISFTTDEGSYMNVDISPDGKTLLFDLLGDLYSVPVVGGKAMQLTHSIALNLRPVWSPDGKNIAYISDISGSFHLNIMDLGGKFHKTLGRSREELYYGFEPLWTPDCHYIAIGDSFYALTGGNIYAGIPLKRFVRFSQNGQLLYGLDSGEICVYNRVNKTKTNLFPVSRKFESVVLSPDTRWLCYIVDSNSQKCLIIRDLINHTDRILVSALIEKNPHYVPEMPPRRYSFSSDSQSIFIAYGGKIHHINIATGTDQIIPFLANVRSNLNQFNYNTFNVSNDSVEVRYTRSANASPDGKHLVFYALGKIYIMDLPAGKAHILSQQSVSQFQPVYSPDGQWVAYVSWCDTTGGYLWRVPASGGRPERLTQIAGQYQHPAWSPDGKFIAVIKGTNKLLGRDDIGIGQVELVSVKDSSSRFIADSVPLWNNLVFSANGQKIIYTPKYWWADEHTLRPQLVSKDLYKDILETIALGTNYSFSQQKTISPDDRYIVYSVDEDLYLVPVCSLLDSMAIFTGNRQPVAIRFAQGIDPYWEQGGKVLAWSYGNRFYRIDPDKIMLAAQKENQTVIDNFITTSVNPDQVIAINLKVSSSYAHGLIALKNVRIIAMKGDAVIQNGTIVVKDGRFMAIGMADKIPIPAGAKVFDLPGATVIPGLIDLHLHMHVPPNIFPQQSWMFLINLAYGVTTARDPAVHYDSFGYTELLKTGQMLGPRLYTVGRPVRLYDQEFRLDNLDDARNIVQKRSIMGGTIMKQYALPTRLQREWLLIASHEAGLNMTNEGVPIPILQLGMMKDGSTGIEHGAIWGDVYKDYISFIAKSNVYITPTLQVSAGNYAAQNYFENTYWSHPDDKLTHFTPAEVLKFMKMHPRDTTRPDFLYASVIDARIRHAGGRVCLGSHGNDEGIGAHNELWALQMGGLTNLEALQAATIMGAEALGVQKDLGSIEVGKIADLIVLNKNPLDDIHNSREIRYVMKDGILYDGNTLDEIWPDAKRCPDWHLHESSTSH